MSANLLFRKSEICTFPPKLIIVVLLLLWYNSILVVLVDITSDRKKKIDYAPIWKISVDEKLHDQFKSRLINDTPSKIGQDVPKLMMRYDARLP